MQGRFCFGKKFFNKLKDFFESKAKTLAFFEKIQ